jgi:hypothetical protein
VRSVLALLCLRICATVAHAERTSWGAQRPHEGTEASSWWGARAAYPMNDQWSTAWSERQTGPAVLR